VLCYFGDLTIANNSSGLHWFCREVLPKIALKRVELRVAGKGSDVFASYEKVESFGFVQDRDDFLRQAHMMIAPIFSGGGLKIKVLDSVGCGKPLVTTPKGAEGFPEWLAQILPVASTAEEFAAKIQKLAASYDVAVDEAKKLQTELKSNMGKATFLDLFLGDINRDDFHHDSHDGKRGNVFVAVGSHNKFIDNF
jgi:glycosyltransferase involved in cell wall biosynthesis